MKKVVFGGLILVLALAICSFTLVGHGNDHPEPSDAAASITWYSFEEAVALSKEKPKKIFIDVYTEWCGWCKKMDKSTFTDAKVAEYMNKHFYAVKFDAEQKEEVEYKGYTLKYRADAGRRGIHELAYSLLDGRMGYPSFVYLDENQDRITISPGYKTPEVILPELKFVAEGHYKDKTYEQYLKLNP